MQIVITASNKLISASELMLATLRSDLVPVPLSFEFSVKADRELEEQLKEGMRFGGKREGEYSHGFTARGKPGPATLHGARQGLNDYTGWFAGDADMGGDYGGYDGPWPPFNDERLHRYRFTVYALDVDTLGLPPRTTGAEALAAISGHVLDQASITVTYALYPAARP